MLLGIPHFRIVRLLVPVFICAFVSCRSLSAATLVTYMFTDYGTTMNTSAGPDAGSVPAQVLAGNLTDFVDDTGSLAAFSSVSDAYFARGNVPLGNSQAGAISGNDYISFTIQPQSGYQLNLTAISFRMGGSTDAGGTSETFSQALRSSADSYAANIDTSSYTLANNLPAPTFDSVRTVSLTAPAFQNLNGSLEFRFYFWSTSAQNNDILRFDSVTLTGDILAVPEPSTWLLLGTGLVSLVLLRRLRR